MDELRQKPPSLTILEGVVERNTGMSAAFIRETTLDVLRGRKGLVDGGLSPSEKSYFQTTAQINRDLDRELRGF